MYGVFEPLLMASDVIYAYARHLGNQVLTVACNWTDQEQPCTLFKEETGRELISNYKQHKPGLLQPYEARVILRDAD